jgi:hypothetical protein
MTSTPKTAEIEAKAEAKGTAPAFEPITFDGVEYPVARKPNSILLSELARTGTGDPESMGVLAEFFEATLGDKTYRDFKRHTYRYDGDESDVLAVVGQIMENTLGRPTE